jgi:hypothetical protein
MARASWRVTTRTASAVGAPGESGARTPIVRRPNDLWPGMVRGPAHSRLSWGV